jgi:uncharacterized repeat protein (TIGR03803 family)
MDPQGILWGTTFQGGKNGSGNLFKLEPASNAIPPTPASVLQSAVKATLAK